MGGRKPDPPFPVPFEFILGKTYFSENGLDPFTGEPMGDCHTNLTSNWRCRGYGAARCWMYPCVRSYKLDITNGAVTKLETNYTTMETLATIPYWNLSSQEGGQNRDLTEIGRASCRERV